MFTEILKVKPVLDNAAAKKMEVSLSARFKRIAGKFEKGLKFSLKAAALAGGAAIAGALVNPVKEVEEKLKTILNKGKSLRDAAADLGTTAGKLGQVEAVAQAKGLEPEKVRAMLESFQKQRDDVAYKQSQGTKLNANEQLLAKLPEDTVDAFFSLQKTLQGLDAKTKARLSKEFLGDEGLRGSTKRFLESDINKEIKSLNVPGQNRINRAAEKTGALADKDLKLGARRDLNELVKTGENKNIGMVVDKINKREDAQAQLFQDQLNAYKNLNQVREGVDKVEKGLQEIILKLGEAIPTMINGFKWITSGKMISDLGKELGRVWSNFSFFGKKK